MTRRGAAPAGLAIALCSVVVAATFGFGAATVSADSRVPAARSGSADGRVLIISAPRLTWSGIQDARPTNLMQLFRTGAVGLTSIRTAGSQTRPGDAYLTIGAGNRMGTVTEVDGTVVSRNEPIVEGDPTSVYTRTTGIVPTDDILAMGKPTIDRLNRAQFFGAKSGSLAWALDRADKSMAVIANADRQFGVPKYRQAGLAAMDRTGQVEAGIVSTELLRAEDSAAFGIALDQDVLMSVFDDVWTDHDVVLVELSDLERAEAARETATPKQGERQYRRALRSGDAIVGKLLDEVDLERDTVIFVAPTPPTTRSQLTAFAIAGPGIEPGLATSSTTRRDGYVTLTDIAPSTLTRLGVAVPGSMNDTRLSSVSSPDDLDTRIDWLVSRGERALVRDKAFGPTTVVFIVVLVIDIALAMLCLARFPKLSLLVRSLALLVLAVPPATYLLGLFPIAQPATLGAAVAGASIVLACLASLTRRIDHRLPPVALMGLLWAVLAVDIATGGRLQIDTVFGYSPIVAGRFAGFGNQAFSMISLSTLLVGAALVDRRTPGGGPASKATIGGVVVFFLVTVVLDGHPSMGSDVGGVMAFVPAATVATLIFAGVKVRPRIIAAIVGGTLAILALFAGIDLSRPEDQRTHLGRFTQKLFDGEAGQIIERKIAANLRVLTSIWAWVIPVALIYFVYLTWRPNHTLQRLNAYHGKFRAFGVAALTLGVLAMALNDSGVSLPAMMVALVAAYVSYLVIDLESA